MSADAVVVGGGVIGLTCARELARRGVATTLLERGPAVGEGSTARANGGVRAQFSTPVNIAFSLFSLQDLERLHRENDSLPAFRQAGYLLMTGDPATAASLRQAMTLQRSLGVETQWLEPDEILARAPFLRADGLLGGTFHARDGYLDPHGVVQAILHEAREAGAAIRTGAEVTAIEPGFTLHLRDGEELRAGWVVNAAGPDARAVAAMLGVDLPVEPVRRNLAFVREPEPGPPIPMCVDLDTGVLVRRDAGGFVVAYSDPDDPPSRETAVDPRFVEQLGERVGNRFPFLETLPIDPRDCWAGLYPETPDHHAIVGEATARYVQCAGFGGHGIMHAPAAARAVAEIVADGACTTFDLHPLRPSRFAEGDLVVESAVF